MKKIVVDLQGADAGSAVAWEGIRLALKANPELSIIAVGRECPEGFAGERVEFVYAEQELTNHDSPMSVFRGKPEASLSKCFARCAADDEVGALVTCGSTGALLVGSIFCLGLVGGMKMPALVSVLPTPIADKLVALLDCGANLECAVEDLERYAVMGSALMQGYCGIAEPRVGLLSVGREDEKGSRLTKAAFKALKELPINFVGNIEGGDALSGSLDVVVCDGFAGNAVLKSGEGSGVAALRFVRERLAQPQSEETRAVLEQLAHRMFMAFDFNSRGGATLLGPRKVLVKGHGAANAATVCSCILQAEKMMEAQIPVLVENALKRLEETNR